MNILSRTLVLVVIGLLGTSQLFAQGNDVYLMFDPSCMDRLEYAYGFTPKGGEYIKYHVQISPTEVIVLEVGTENSSKTQNYLNASTISCGDPSLSRDLADQIRNSKTKAYIVRSSGNNQYLVNRVNQASYFRRDSRGVTYDSWQFSFNHSGGLRPGQNLTEGSVQGVNVFFEGTTQYKCADAYKFKQTFQYASEGTYRELIFVPGIGIVEERPGTGDSNNLYQLKTVNDEPFDSYLQKICARGITVSSNFLANSGTPQTNNNYGSVSMGSNVTGGITPYSPTSTGSVATAQTHVVQRGETLFSISRKYNISVDQIRQWNNMGSSSAINAGQKLVVSDPALATRGASGGNTTPQPYTPQQPAHTNNAVPGSSNQPITPYGSNLPTSGYAPNTNTGTSSDSGLPAWKTTDGRHTFQAGETVALLALRYGYTEARFRDMNNLGPNEMPKVGSTLRTTDCPTTTSSSSNRFLGQPAYSTPTPGSAPAQSQNSVPPTNNYSGTPNSGATLPSSSGTQPQTPLYTRSTPAGTSGQPTAPTGTTPSASFEPYGFNSPNFDNLSSASSNSGSQNTGTLPNSNYNNTDYYPPARNNNPNYNNNGSGNSIQPYNPNSTTPQPGSSVPQGNTLPTSTQQPSSSGFGTPVPSSGGNTGNTGTLPTYNNSNSKGIFDTAANDSGTYQRQENTPIEPYNYTPSQSSGNQQVHVVKEGENLDTIARMYQTTPEQLRAINNLDKNEVIIPYQKIYID